ncbi:hypothetical protein [Rhodovulum sp. P5]|uniref:hypothetical protein n=1 Tax=Rhodovulum sp. P5 TaxID=1564506 RepID=UPI001C12C29A|nr:hypothetical protein [Rhodovulum sp. P5]
MKVPDCSPLSADWANATAAFCALFVATLSLWIGILQFRRIQRYDYWKNISQLARENNEFLMKHAIPGPRTGAAASQEYRSRIEKYKRSLIEAHDNQNETARTMLRAALFNQVTIGSVAFQGSKGILKKADSERARRWTEEVIKWAFNFRELKDTLMEINTNYSQLYEDEFINKWVKKPLYENWPSSWGAKP